MTKQSHPTGKKIKVDYQKINDIWMHKDKSGIPMQDPNLDNHWIACAGNVVVEATTKKKCLEMVARGENSLKASVLRNDIKNYGGSEEDLERLKDYEK